MDTYYESAEGVTISHKRALQELYEHGIGKLSINEGYGDSIEEFYNDLGKHAEYDAQAVLNWLGY